MERNDLFIHSAGWWEFNQAWKYACYDLAYDAGNMDEFYCFAWGC